MDISLLTDELMNLPDSVILDIQAASNVDLARHKIKKLIKKLSTQAIQTAIKKDLPKVPEGATVEAEYGSLEDDA